MVAIGDRYIEADTVSEGWLDALRVVSAVPKRKVAVHLVVRIRRPNVEVAAIRAAADEVVAAHPKKPWSIDSTRNTIFPKAWADRHPEPSELAAYYRERYPNLRGFRGNELDTYFGRIVCYPRTGDDYGDQLSSTVNKLRSENRHRNPKSSRYEINIYSEAKDQGRIMSFPCLAHVSLHRHAGTLNMQAVYRNEYLVGRAYGNFLGLGQLLAYIAGACGLATGELLMTINHAEVDSFARARLAPALDLH